MAMLNNQRVRLSDSRLLLPSLAPKHCGTPTSQPAPGVSDLDLWHFNFLQQEKHRKTHRKQHNKQDHQECWMFNHVQWCLFPLASSQPGLWCDDHLTDSLHHRHASCEGADAWQAQKTDHQPRWEKTHRQTQTPGGRLERITRGATAEARATGHGTI